MPTDVLVDVVTIVKLVNVRKSRAEDAGKAVADYLTAPEDMIYLWDKAELGPLQLIGEMGAGHGVPIEMARKYGVDEASVRKELAKHFKKLEASGRVVTEENGKDKPEAGRVPVPSASKKKELPDKKYIKLPKDFEDQAVKYVEAHDGCSLTSLAEGLKVNVKSAYPHMEKLVKQGLVTKEKAGPAKWDPTKYHLAKPAEQKVEDKTHLRDITKGEPPEVTHIAVPAAAEKPMEPIVSPQVIESFKGMRTRYDKESEAKQSILRLLESEPGLNVTNIAKKIKQDVVTVRKYLIELEEERKIAPVKVPGQFGPRTGYYLKAAVPKEAC